MGFVAVYAYSRICADCDEDMLCHLCVDRIHRTGNASTHLRVPIEMCEECSFQVRVKLDSHLTDYIPAKGSWFVDCQRYCIPPQMLQHISNRPFYVAQRVPKLTACW